MQPLAYLAIRIGLSLLQFFEAGDRRFADTIPITLAAGAAHCWAVVYALIIAVIVQLNRLKSLGVFQDIPFYVYGAEKLACLSILVWLVVGCLLGAVRLLMLDEEVHGLPMRVQDTRYSWWIGVVLNKNLRQSLPLFYLLSCAGLFVTILLLCVAILASGSISTCEITVVSFAAIFAWPHAAVAVERTWHLSSWAKEQKERKCLPVASGVNFVAAAREAAFLLPQLSLILACGEVNLQASSAVPLWQRFLYVFVLVAVGAAVLLSALTPKRYSASATPIRTIELSVSVFLDIVAILLIHMSFKDLGPYAGLTTGAFTLLLSIAAGVRDLRAELVEVIEPLMPLLTSPETSTPAHLLRERVRCASQALAVVCGAAVWLTFYRRVIEVPDPYGYQSTYPPSYDGEDWQPQSNWPSPTWVLLRWAPAQPGPSTEQASLFIEGASKALNVTVEDLNLIILPEHRIIMLRFATSEIDDKRERWATALGDASNPTGQWTAGELNSKSFPYYLDYTSCDNYLGYGDDDVQANRSEQEKEERIALRAACDARWQYPGYSQTDNDPYDSNHYRFRDGDDHLAEPSMGLGDGGESQGETAQSSVAAIKVDVENLMHADTSDQDRS